jgi:hypothetical protein
MSMAARTATMAAAHAPHATLKTVSLDGRARAAGLVGMDPAPRRGLVRRAAIGTEV